MNKLHHNKVRAFIKKNGFNVGSWAKNGRISGMSNFHGEVDISQSYDSVQVSVHSRRLSRSEKDVISSQLLSLLSQQWNVVVLPNRDLIISNN